MELFYWKSANGNVGDDLNAWLWPRIFGEGFFDSDLGARFLGIGSVLAGQHMLDKPALNIIFGPGLRSAETVSSLADFDMDIRFVRGPLSAAALGNAPYISDPAILSPRYAQKRAPVPGRIGFVPYMRTPDAISRKICETTGAVCLPVTMEVEPFFDALMQCEHVVCEAMHGAILADAFRIPWAGCRITSALFEGKTSFFKWMDWQKSLGHDVPLACSLPEVTFSLPKRMRQMALGRVLKKAPDMVAEIIRKKAWSLSSDMALTDAQDKIMEQVALLKREAKSLKITQAQH